MAQFIHVKLITASKCSRGQIFYCAKIFASPNSHTTYTIFTFTMQAKTQQTQTLEEVPKVTETETGSNVSKTALSRSFVWKVSYTANNILVLVVRLNLSPYSTSRLKMTGAPTARSQSVGLATRRRKEAVHRTMLIISGKLTRSHLKVRTP